MSTIALRENVVIPSAIGSTSPKASSDERIVFNDSEQLLRFENKNKYEGIKCQFNYLSTDRLGRDLYQVIRTKL